MSQINVKLTRQAKLLEYANNKRTDGDFNDVTIQAGNESIPANRMILACYSKFFESMFLSPLKERYQNTVEIKTFEGMAVKQIIEYIYTGIIDINTSNVLTLLRTADFLQVDDIKNMCFDFMETSLTVDNCLNVLKASVLYNTPSLQKTYQYISDNFDEIVQGDNFKQLSKDELLSLFTNVDRKPVQEMLLYTAVIDWIKYDQKREVEFATLFLNLNLNEFPSKFVASRIAEEPLIKDSKECLNAVVTYYSDKERKVKADSQLSKVLCVGGDESKSVSEVYSACGDSLNSYPDLPCNLSGHCALKVDDFVYCLGGTVDGNYTTSINQVYRLNLKAPNSGWEEVASMAKKRFEFGAAVYKGCLVVAGGHNGTSRICSAELYEPRLNRWRTIASLNNARDEHALVVQDEKLFDIGGSVEGKSLSSMYQLDDLDGKWKETKSMNVERENFAAVTCNDFIYAIGGYDQDTFATHKSVEKYDVNENEWSFVSSMNVERCDHAACVLDGKIYVIGGTDENNDVIKTIECYNPSTDQWTVVGEVKQNFQSHSVVAV